MFNDQRSKKVLLVAHCILNQNAKIDRCAHFPGAVPDLLRPLLDAGIGILQMPCPELLGMGLDRQAEPGRGASVEAEDTRVAAWMQATGGQAVCRQLAAGLGYQVEQYRRNGFEVLGVLGVNGSPTCGVETNWEADEEKAQPGVFIRTLQAELAGRGMALPMRGVKVYQPVPARVALLELIAPA
ncbi:MAG: hypothetical protein GYA17_10990 [Chloroflexi bacterium]|jgi:predicted secreted protein|nr:hypothetical protein [Anaerolineaceae bacterium]NMB88877.1 hypothetical protein [Chloroflexota bacterium]